VSGRRLPKRGIDGQQGRAFARRDHEVEVVPEVVLVAVVRQDEPSEAMADADPLRASEAGLAPLEAIVGAGNQLDAMAVDHVLELKAGGPLRGHTGHGDLDCRPCTPPLDPHPQRVRAPRRSHVDHLLIDRVQAPTRRCHGRGGRRLGCARG